MADKAQRARRSTKKVMLQKASASEIAHSLGITPVEARRAKAAVSFAAKAGAWILPKNTELIALYRLRYKMALDERKYDAALIFLNKILELDPLNAEASLCKGEIYHRCLQDYAKAIEQYKKVLRTTSEKESASVHVRARAAMAEIMELLS